MSKKERVEHLMGEKGAGGEEVPAERFYAGYFQCFNDQRYYEAHDVLEQLWLREPGENFLYYKGLIQMAGAFVHLQKQYARPHHPKDGKRLRPAVRLFKLAMKNLGPFRPRHLGVDVEAVCLLCQERAAEIEKSEFQVNPWSPDRAPALPFK